MKMLIDDEFRQICEMISKENKTDHDWSLIESSDMFQTDSYCGGFDSTEKAFCFSYYNRDGKEFWFQIRLEDIKNILEKKINSVEIRSAE